MGRPIYAASDPALAAKTIAQSLGVALIQATRLRIGALAGLTGKLVGTASGHDVEIAPPHPPLMPLGQYPFMSHSMLLQPLDKDLVPLQQKKVFLSTADPQHTKRRLTHDRFQGLQCFIQCFVRLPELKPATQAKSSGCCRPICKACALPHREACNGSMFATFLNSVMLFDIRDDFPTYFRFHGP